MSVGWMALVGAFIAVEKMLPWKRLANRSVAVALAVIALSIALTPAATGGMGM
jgi:predicted metal-binding membrane protein